MSVGLTIMMMSNSDGRRFQIDGNDKDLLRENDDEY